MATYTTYTDGTNIAARSGTGSEPAPRQIVIWNDVDFSKRNAAAADVFEVLNIPANAFVERVNVRTLLGEASQTLSVGDGSGTSSWLSATDVATTGNVASSTLAMTEGTPNTVTGYSAGKFYSAADTIDILVPAGKAYTTLKVRVSAAVTLFG